MDILSFGRALCPGVTIALAGLLSFFADPALRIIRLGALLEGCMFHPDVKHSYPSCISSLELRQHFLA